MECQFGWNRKNSPAIWQNGGEKEPADVGIQPPVVPEIGTQNARQREHELPMGQAQQEPLVHVLGEQRGSLLRAGGAEAEGFAAEGRKVFRPAVGIAALNAGDTLGVVPAQDELDAKSTVNEGVLEQKLKGIDSVRTVHWGAEGGKRKRCLNMHSETQRGDRSS